MAKFRHVHTTFWDDGFVLDLTPEEKYFYLYLMTNGNTTQCGIYELPYRVIEMHTGYNRETVQKLLQRFFEYGKISYNELTKEIMLINWAKYNFINSPKVKKCIEKELLAVKHIPFVRSYVTSLEQLGYSIDTVCIWLNKLNEQKESNDSNNKDSIPYPYPIDRPSKDCMEEEKQQEKIKEKEKETTECEDSQSTVTNEQLIFLTKFYDENIQKASSYICECIEHMACENNPVLVYEAMKIAVLQQPNKPIQYIERILVNWRTDLITNDGQLKAKEQREINKRQQSFPYSYQKSLGRREIVPEWFDKRNDKVEHPIPSTESNNSAIDFEAERQKVLEMLGK
ncbi:DnaD domain protein [Lysinibacillus sphaericus]|uniref:DnaD domain protein n=1 Tax=Lysinibacillus sphaericus TaxID=1421 RepID=UPI000C1A055A|nr:DnaD domain protein [Lysinibacillus sphaericus]PIJ99954.1 DNA replication protein DnaD [Lysinibacillus sphaericus]